MKRHIDVLTSGGDCPGLNAIMRAVVLAADKLGWRDPLWRESRPVGE